MKNLSKKNPCARCKEKDICAGACEKANKWQKDVIKKLGEYEAIGFEPWEIAMALGE